MNVSQDRNFSQLLTIYLHYGLSVPINAYYSPYWYNSNLVNLKTPIYFRWITTKNKTLGFNTVYRLRTKTTDLYPMKLWILKYNNWLILNLYWFQPNKFKRRRLPFRWTPIELTDIKLALKLNNDIRLRLKTLVSYNFLKVLLKKEYYLF